jgi:preprotein translocase subunit SecB
VILPPRRQPTWSGAADLNLEKNMSEVGSNNAIAAGSPPPSGPQAVMPPLTVNVQYVKDLSFEVPGAPQIYSTLRSQPQVSINLDVQVRRLAEGQPVFEVTLAIRAEGTDPNQAATEPKQFVFIAELSYAGLFTLTNVPDNAVEPMLLVECPRLMFPYARNILADITRDGGFPPVLLQPIDFVSLWQARRAQAVGSQPTAVV